MKRLFLLALIVIAVWQASKHYPQLLHPQPYHEAVVRNRTKERIERVRLTVGDQTFVREVLESGEAAVFPFRVTHDSNFKLVWQRQGKADDIDWTGGWVTAGPMMQRHTITMDNYGVVYHAEKRVAEEASK